jgi:hypothetical protein
MNDKNSPPAKNHSSVPVLITWDVDPDRWTTLEKREKSLSMAMELCAEFNIRSTFFFTARYAHEYPLQIDHMQQLGQEIGCHGLNHTDEEDYDRMQPDQQRAYIEEATKQLQAVAGAPVTSFRSPRVKTSACTLMLLNEFGYLVDSSVCSQRMDLISSNLINPGWLFAPRLPYHPHPASAYKPGNTSIWEVPVSAAGLPFISSSLRVLGLPLMKAFFWLLYQEARVTGKPIVYLSHPTEFIPSNGQKAALSLADFSPRRIRTHGLVARKLIYRLSGQALYTATRCLFSYIASLPDVRFSTCHEYAGCLNPSSKIV